MWLLLAGHSMAGVRFREIQLTRIAAAHGRGTSQTVAACPSDGSRRSSSLRAPAGYSGTPVVVPDPGRLRGLDEFSEHRRQPLGVLQVREVRGAGKRLEAAARD